MSEVRLDRNVDRLSPDDRLVRDRTHKGYIKIEAVLTDIGQTRVPDCDEIRAAYDQFTEDRSEAIITPAAQRLGPVAIKPVILDKISLILATDASIALKIRAIKKAYIERFRTGELGLDQLLEAEHGNDQELVAARYRLDYAATFLLNRTAKVVPWLLDSDTHGYFKEKMDVQKLRETCAGATLGRISEIQLSLDGMRKLLGGDAGAAAERKALARLSQRNQPSVLLGTTDPRNPIQDQQCSALDSGKAPSDSTSTPPRQSPQTPVSAAPTNTKVPPLPPELIGVVSEAIHRLFWSRVPMFSRQSFQPRELRERADLTDSASHRSTVSNWLTGMYESTPRYLEREGAPHHYSYRQVWPVIRK